MKIVRPRESTVETQPQLQPGFDEIVSHDLPVFHVGLIVYRLPSTQQ